MSLMALLFSHDLDLDRNLYENESKIITYKPPS